MKIKLHNFRCHADAEFDLPDTGLVLLSGSSGAGKSTLIKAILYALFGTKAVRKPYSFGTLTCSVSFEFNGLRIERTNRPNRLVVNDRLEDDAAQSFLNEQLGVGYDEFLMSSYIPQKNNSSVLSLNQPEQLRLIKTLAFQGDKNEQQKERLKEMTHESSTNLVEKRTEHQFIQAEATRLQDTLTPVKFPLEKVAGKKENVIIDEFRDRFKNYNSLVTGLLNTKEELNNEINNYQRCSNDISNNSDKKKQYLEEIDKKKARIDILCTFLENIPEDLKEQKGLTEKSIKFLELQSEYNLLQSQYDKINKAEDIEKSTHITELTTKIWQGNDEQDSLEQLKSLNYHLTTWNNYNSGNTQFKNLLKELGIENGEKEQLLKKYTGFITKLSTDKKELYSSKESLAIAAEKLALEKELVQCPECDSYLRWQNNSLISVHDHIPTEERNYKNEIISVEKNITNIDKKITKYNDIIKRINAIHIPTLKKVEYTGMEKKVKTLNTYISQNKRWEEELTRLKSSTGMTPALRNLQKQLDAKKNLMNGLEVIPTDDIDTLRDTLRVLTEQINNYQQYSNEYKILNSSISDLSTKLENINKNLHSLNLSIKNVNINDLKKKLEKVCDEITCTKTNQLRDISISENLEKYILYIQQKEDYNRWNTKLENITKQLRIAEHIHTANLTLKDKYIQAEILALESTISSINEHTRYYLDTFFADHQLGASLEASHKGKKIQTLKINTVINYKGNEYDNISQMSGGEFDRCTLASVCGINSMLGSPILILDESLSSLDTDTNTEIIRFLSELSQDKLILVCSHEAVRGIFDHIIEL